MDSSGRRFRTLSNDESLAPEKGDYCVRYHLKSADRNPVLREPSADKSPVLDVYGCTCRHPDNHTIAVDRQYSRRAARVKTDPGFAAAAESFLDG